MASMSDEQKWQTHVAALDGLGDVASRTLVTGTCAVPSREKLATSAHEPRPHRRALHRVGVSHTIKGCAGRQPTKQPTPRCLTPVLMIIIQMAARAR